jgi:uncharacterized protein (DUF433 family)
VASAMRAKGSQPSRIVRDPAVCGGEPTIEGTRVPVRSIVIQWQFHRDLERVQSAFPRVDIPAIKEALAYYEMHRDEIDRLIEDSEQAAYATE